MAGDRKVLTNLDFQSTAKVINLPNPTDAADAANKAYVDSLIQGLAWKDSARAASTGNVSISAAPATIDGVTLALNDRVLLKDQSTASENGIYVFNGAGSPLTRAEDADTFDELEAAVIGVEEGTVNLQTQFRQTEVNGTIDVDPVTWSTFAANVPQATETQLGIVELATQAEVDAGTDTQRVVTPATLRNASFIPENFAQTFGDTSNTQFTINHNLNTEDVNVFVREATGNRAEVITDIRVVDANNILVCTAVPPGTNALRVVVTG